MSNPYLDGVYNVGTVTLTAGSKDFTTKDANLRSDAPILAGDRIHVNGKELIIEAITDMDKGRLYYDCPSDCAGTDIPLVITLISSPARIQSNAAKLIDKLSKGYLSSLAELTAKDGQIFCATNVQGELRASDLNADSISETDWRKFMTADERNKLAGINGLDQNTWNSGTDWTTALISPQNLIGAIHALIHGLDQQAWNSANDWTEALISPQKLLGAIKSAFGGNNDTGWVKMPNGVIIQWGFLASQNGNYAQVWFPTVFTTKCIFLPTAAQGWQGEWFAPIVFADWYDKANLAARGMHFRQITGTSGVSFLNTCDVNWIAIGY